MPQNISGINTAGQTEPLLYQISSPGADDDKTVVSNTDVIEISDENTYQDTNFEDMSLEDVTEAALNLEQELLGLKTEIENLQTVIDANEEIRAMYEEQVEQAKQQIKELGEKLKKAETPQEKEDIKASLTRLNSNLSSLYSKISEMRSLILANNHMKTAASSDYASTSAEYRKASLAQNAKEAEMQRNIQASQNSAQNSISINAPSAAGAAGAVNNNISSAAPDGPSAGKASDNLINFLKQKEGCKLQAYQDSGGVWTIGYGHTSGVRPGQTISQAQAEQFLRQDLTSFENEVSSLAQSTGVQLSQGQFDALVSFTYNCGGGNLRKSGIMQMLKTGDISGAQNKMKQYIHDASGNALQGLVTRRETEANWLSA